jgi:hypothetical protein
MAGDLETGADLPSLFGGRLLGAIGAAAIRPNRAREALLR